MDRVTFEVRLLTAARHAVEFARDFVYQLLPDELGFRVYPNQSFDSTPRVGDEVIFPEESVLEGAFHGPWSTDETVDYLWRAGKVPEWIDVAVEASVDRFTLVALRCCGRFTASEDLRYHRLRGLSPFSIKSPWLPPGWESIEASGRFDLNWRQL
jgi:hypothetical protein